MYVTTIRDMLRYISYDQYGIGREFNYDEPVGGFINNDETEYNQIVWNEGPMGYPMPSWGDFFTSQFNISRSAFWNAAYRIVMSSPLIGEEFPNLVSAVDAVQSVLTSMADKTITASGITGAQTINKRSGSVNFAANTSSLVVTNNLVNSSSVIVATVAANDTNMNSVKAVPGSGSFTLYVDQQPMDETRINWAIIA